MKNIDTVGLKSVLVQERESYNCMFMCYEVASVYGRTPFALWSLTDVFALCSYIMNGVIVALLPRDIRTV